MLRVINSQDRNRNHITTILHIISTNSDLVSSLFNFSARDNVSFMVAIALFTLLRSVVATLDVFKASVFFCNSIFNSSVSTFIFAASALDFSVEPLFKLNWPHCTKIANNAAGTPRIWIAFIYQGVLSSVRFAVDSDGFIEFRISSKSFPKDSNRARMTSSSLAIFILPVWLFRVTMPITLSLIPLTVAATKTHNAEPVWHQKCWKKMHVVNLGHGWTTGTVPPEDSAF
jgi:hypothetical protein